jgi:hypothetical protein
MSLLLQVGALPCAYPDPKAASVNRINAAALETTLLFINFSSIFDLILVALPQLPAFNAEELLNLNVSGLGFGGPLPLLGGPITAEAYAVGTLPRAPECFLELGDSEHAHAGQKVQSIAIRECLTDFGI